MKGEISWPLGWMIWVCIAMSGDACREQSPSSSSSSVSALGSNATPAPGGAAPAAITVMSAAFAANSPIPEPYTCDGADISPPLEWRGAPPQTKAIAVICDDPDAPSGVWTHWVLYDLPGLTNALPENVAKDRSLPSGAKQGQNDFGKIGYNGPCPPPGSPPHHYHFKIYALDQPLRLAAGMTRADLLKSMRSHIVGEGELIGTRQRAAKPIP